MDTSLVNQEVGFRGTAMPQSKSRVKLNGKEEFSMRKTYLSHRVILYTNDRPLMQNGLMPSKRCRFSKPDSCRLCQR